jgi:predicted membrane-bound mannosyltransferase
MMILNYRFSGDMPSGYHFVNVLLHIASVLLLYRLFGKLGLKSLHCFLLSLLFAVHPVLSQAVAWIPGRNDTLLAVFVLLFFINSINYTTTGKTNNLALSGLFLLLAFFTKETAVFAAPAAFALLVLYKDTKVQDRNMYPQYIVWVVCFGIWFAARSAATIQSAI